MDESTDKFETLLLTITECYSNGHFEETIAAGKLLQADVIKCLKEDGQIREYFAESFYKPLMFILGNESKKIDQNVCDVSATDLLLVEAILGCLRNSFYKNPFNQMKVAEEEELRRPLLSILNSLVVCLCPYIQESINNQSLEVVNRSTDSNTLESSYTTTTLTCVTTFVNMMAGNSRARKLTWPFLQNLILSVMSVPIPSIRHMGAALLHQFLLEEELKQELVESDEKDLVVISLLQSYLNKGPHSCFSLFCLEILVADANAVATPWERLSDEESLLFLDVLTSSVQKAKTNLPLSTVLFLSEVFKKEADHIFGIQSKKIASISPKVVARITNFLSCAASSDQHRTNLQEDKSLLISSVYLLRGMSAASEQRSSSKLDLEPGTSSETEGEVFGFKCDIIRLIAGLAYQSKSNQDTVREIDGLLLVLENSQYDARNPFIREASIFALRNLLQGNLDNQKIISELRLCGVTDNKTLERLGLTLDMDGGKMVLRKT